MLLFAIRIPILFGRYSNIYLIKSYRKNNLYPRLHKAYYATMPRHGQKNKNLLTTLKKALCLYLICGNLIKCYQQFIHLISLNSYFDNYVNLPVGALWKMVNWTWLSFIMICTSNYSRHGNWYMLSQNTTFRMLNVCISPGFESFDQTNTPCNYILHNTVTLSLWLRLLYWLQVVYRASAGLANALCFDCCTSQLTKV